MVKSESVEPKISPAEVDERRRDGLFVLDVRNEEDYRAWPIDGSHNVPIYDELLEEEFDGLEAAVDELPTDQEIAVVCVAGITSSRAAAWLRERGYAARSMTDGMNGWGRLHRTYDVSGAPGVHQIVRPGTGCLSYLLHDRGEVLVIDPSLYTEVYRDAARDLDAEIVGVVDTHVHADHVSGAGQLASTLEVPYYLHPADSGSLNAFQPVSDGATITVGDRDVEVIHTPGHTPGSVTLQSGTVLFTGDTLFLESLGRPDLEDDDRDAVTDAAGDLFDSLDRLTARRDNLLVLPGHFDDETMRPVGATLYDLSRTHRFLDLVEAGDRDTFVEAIRDGLSAQPNNYKEIKRINSGAVPLPDEAPRLELGPNNCAAN